MFKANRAIVMFMMVFAVLFLAGGTTFAQSATDDGAGDGRRYPLHSFATKEACLAALEKGEHYEPSYFSDRKRTPRVPIANSGVLMELMGCAYMKVAGGSHRWVPQRAGTKIDYDKDGNPVRRSDCGNDITEIVYPPQRPPVVLPPPPSRPKQYGCIVGGKKTMNHQGGMLPSALPVKMVLDGNLTAIVAADGTFRFDHVEVGEHVLTEEIPEGYQQLAMYAGGQKFTDNAATINVVAGDECASVIVENQQLPPAAVSPPEQPKPAPAPPPEQVAIPPIDLGLPPVGEGPGFCEELPGPWVTKPIVWVGQQIKCHPLRTALVAAAAGCIATGIAGVVPCGRWPFGGHHPEAKPPVKVISPSEAVKVITPQAVNKVQLMSFLGIK